MDVIRIFTRGEAASREPNLLFKFVNLRNPPHYPIALGNRGRGSSFEILHIEMAPARSLAHPDSLFTTGKNLVIGLVVPIDKGLCLFGDEGLCCSGFGVNPNQAHDLVTTLVVAEHEPIVAEPSLAIYIKGVRVKSVVNFGYFSGFRLYDSKSRLRHFVARL